MIKITASYSSSVKNWNKYNEWRIINVCSDNWFPGSQRWTTTNKYFGQISGNNLPSIKGLKITFDCEVIKKGNKEYCNCINWHYASPENNHQIEVYLEERLFKEKLISKSEIKKLVKTYGIETLNIFTKEELALLMPFFKNIDNVKAAIEIVNKDTCYNEFCQFMVNLGVKFNIIRRIYNYYGSDSLNITMENPFLCMEIGGIGFITCDNIAKSLKVALDSPERIVAGTKFVLEQLTSMSGHLYIPVKVVIDKATQLLGVSAKAWQDAINADMHSSHSNFLVFNQNIMLIRDNNNETYTCRRIHALSTRNKKFENVDEIADEVNSKRTMKLSEKQMLAVKNSLKNSFSIITGGPGTGKSTIMKVIIDVYKELSSRPITLMSPTGKAASRMTECTGIPARTIHSTLKLKPDMDSMVEKIPEGLIIIDEVSMIDQELMSKLMSAIPFYSTVVMIGDIDQLPSVGKGDVLNQIIKSEQVSVTRLTETFRQKNGSLIIDNAYKINNGDTSLQYDEFFSFYEMKDSDYGKLVNLYLEKVQKYGIDQVAVLCPRRKQNDANPLNMVSENLNVLIQARVNPKTANSLFSVITNSEGRKIEYRVNDRIMSWKNTEDVSNGEVGVITNISNDSGEVLFTVDWENGTSTSLTIDNMRDMSLAYAMSIHKSQGSEYKCVILPFLKEHHCQLFRRNLLYTGITRAKKECILVGDKESIDYCITHKTTGTRNSYLAMRMSKYSNK